ncbi:hypothetical protein [Caulobacter sp. Root343]|uniref:hypothetical protein n=1 Tax=Caulobacter sp. Root343 TaxID=1736520 RepID=UPI0007022076|nr:hypothetical protein [Caulobacter sp. Root343]KQV66636.1 hypothetical protein ASC70_12445 [Caulobacter sp. Root343]
MADPNPNRLRAAHDALWALVGTLFAGDTLHRNPSGLKAPAAKTDGLAGYVAQHDDNLPETVGVVCGPIYDLKATAEVTIAFSGKTKDDRQAAAYVKLEMLKTAIAADRQLGGAVDYADIAGAQPTDVPDSDWMAGGLYVQIGLLFGAPTPAG